MCQHHISIRHIQCRKFQPTGWWFKNLTATKLTAGMLSAKIQKFPLQSSVSIGTIRICIRSSQSSHSSNILQVLQEQEPQQHCQMVQNKNAFKFLYHCLNSSFNTHNASINSSNTLFCIKACLRRTFHN